MICKHKQSLPPSSEDSMKDRRLEETLLSVITCCHIITRSRIIHQPYHTIDKCG